LPSRSLLAQNALTAADAILVPTQADYLAVQGLELTFQTALQTQRQSKGPRRRPLPPGCAATRYTAPFGISVLAKAVIEVPGPTHLLHGLRLPCLRVTNRAHLHRLARPGHRAGHPDRRHDLGRTAPSAIPLPALGPGYPGSPGRASVGGYGPDACRISGGV